MGIIISSFVGCGRTFFKNEFGDKIKIADACDKAPSEILDYVSAVIDENDVVFIPSSLDIRTIFNENKIDYDVFYPSKERRNEFIEALVRKHVNSKNIMDFDRNFDQEINEIDGDRSKNCYKHKLSNAGEFIGNYPTILQYVDSLKKEES